MVPLAGAGDDVGDGHTVCLDGGAGHEDASLAISGGAVAAVIWMELVSMEMQVWLSVDAVELVSTSIWIKPLLWYLERWTSSWWWMVVSF